MKCIISKIFVFMLFSKLIFYITGEAFPISFSGSNERNVKILPSLVIGVVDLGNNNAYNQYGWSSVKPVVVNENQLYVVDFPECIWWARVDENSWPESDGELNQTEDESWLWEPEKYGLLIFGEEFRNRINQIYLF
ncbi:hypothetical protein [Larkinella rosea]|uniref:Uncharacterized protein n=1 Tax=Larkinella rosea TaxID=2025312 RepID=A0A3P1BMP3_9BACT|nr:hypothetical protein [Larkinella rosea]RRB02056.1 hypothetical protein EHT25_16325 [Larkinella rosea]